jgi:hypothetical protein
LAVAVGLSVVRAPARLATAAVAAAAGNGRAVRIEVNSDPPGASVTGSNGRLGVTPLVLMLPESSEVEELRFAKPGFASEVYDLHPKSGGFVFVELRPAGAPAAGSAQDRL